LTDVSRQQVKVKVKATLLLVYLLTTKKKEQLMQACPTQPA